MTETARYASLAQARIEIKATGASASASEDTEGTAADAYLLDALYKVSGRIDNHKGLTYAPYLIGSGDKDAYYDSFGWHIDDFHNALTLRVPMLTITSVVVGGTTWVADTDYVPIPRAGTPITGIRILPGSGKSWENYVTDWHDSILITGLGGYHRSYATAWRSSGDTVEDNPLAADAVEISVNDADGADSYGVTPRFSAGQLLRIGAGNDFREVLAVNTGTNKLTVRSSARGSTSASQAQNTAISIWQPEEAVQRACMRWVSYLYKRRGTFAGSEVDTLTGQTLTEFPPDMPTEVLNALDELPAFYIGEGV